jgi:hypothetical protein
MPSILVETSIAAGAVNNNLVSGSAYEFSRGRSLLSLGITAAATGSFFTLQSGSDVIVEESAPPVLTRYPVVPDEMYFNDVMENGDRLVVRARNPTGGAIIHRVMALMSPIG